MIQENYINCTLLARNDVTKFENLSYSADSLSDVDLLDSTFNFELEPYVALNTIKATSKCNKKGLIKFPQFLGRISTMNKNKRENLNYEDVKFLGETPNVSKVKTEPKIKAEPKAKKEG
jgi:hypothetical protein